MIEINLLPEELRKNKTKKEKMSLSVNAKFLPYLIAAAIGIVICVHIYLAVAALGKNSQLKKLNSKWESLSAERKALEQFNKEHSESSADSKEIKQLIKDRINWSAKFNKLSLSLPTGIWFNEVSANQRELIVNGSAVSLRKDETSLIKEFVDSLKADKDFYQGFKSLELSSTQRKERGGYEIVDFVLIGTLN